MVAVLVAAGCGRSGSPKSTGTTVPAGTAKTAGGTAAAASGVGDFGTLKSVCGPGNATGATDPGVSNTSINVATMADPGFTGAPGLDQEMFDAADAFVGWCNAAGGILGRKIVLHKRDAALTNVAAKMIEACDAPDFMLVGNGEALDATGVQQRLSCKLPEIAGYDVSAAAGTAPLSVDPIPTPDNMSSLGGAFRALAKFDPSVLPKYGLVNSNQQSVKDSGNRDKAAAAAVGFTVASYQEAPTTIDNYRPFVENLHSAGVQVASFQTSPIQVAGYMKSMADIGYFPKYALLVGNNYDPTLISLAGSALSGFTGGALIGTYVVPFELAGQYPAVQKYIDLLNQYVGGAKPKSLGINSMSAWLLWAQSAKACGSNLTRDCVMANAAAVKNWTGGGLHAPVNPGNATDPGSNCFTLVKATPSGFVLVPNITKPNNGIFNCDPANEFALKGFPQAS
jgi:ABC-type branched-subunit amino acid transport system substrate-binding protein